MGFNSNDVWKEAEKDFNVMHAEITRKNWDSSQQLRNMYDDLHHYYEYTYDDCFLQYLKQHYALIKNSN